MVAVPEEFGPAGEFSIKTTEHFRIVWGPNTPDNSLWEPSADPNTPIWVALLAEYLEDAYTIQLSEGFPAAYGSDTYYLDVYVANTGLTIGGTPLSIGPNYYAYTQIDNAYDVAYFVYNTIDSLNALKATAAHELFHAVQRATGYPWDDEDLIPSYMWLREQWWVESTATWAEEITFPDVNDYFGYISYFLSDPEKSLSYNGGLENSLRVYGAAIFPGYLWLNEGGYGGDGEHPGSDLIRVVFENAYGLGVELAIDTYLRSSIGYTLEDAVTEFWTLTSHPEDFWPDGSHYSVPTYVSTVSTTPKVITPTLEQLPDKLGANLYRVSSSRLPATIDFAPESSSLSDWTMAVACEGQDFYLYINPAELPLLVDRCPGNYTYLSFVNTSSSVEGYSVGFGENLDLPQVTSGGGGGGCFIEALMQ
ncbi:MAG: hypothetical protein C0609_07465 [Deltaproteobacteria bacterium]|nr:MAG: hypothetical protein C0609_07465 [Deltaproteobacteria bacterium]